MSKLVYPNDGIFKYCKNDIDTITGSLSKIISNCTFDIPSNFNYKSYLSNLGNVVSDYHKEIRSINYRLQCSNNNYETLENDLTNNVKKMSTIKIDERDRMII